MRHSTLWILANWLIKNFFPMKCVPHWHSGMWWLKDLQMDLCMHISGICVQNHPWCVNVHVPHNLNTPNLHIQFVLSVFNHHTQLFQCGTQCGKLYCTHPRLLQCFALYGHRDLSSKLNIKRGIKAAFTPADSANNGWRTYLGQFQLINLPVVVDEGIIYSVLIDDVVFTFLQSEQSIDVIGTAANLGQCPFMAWWESWYQFLVSFWMCLKTQIWDTIELF